MKINKNKNFILKHCLFAGLLLCALLFCAHDAFLYSTTIAKVTKAETKVSDSASNYNSGDYTVTEKTYVQTLTLKILNGEYKGKRATYKNEYNYSQVDTTKYRRGDQVFVTATPSGKSLSVSISGYKRDSYALILLLLFLYLCILISGKRGLLVLVTTGVNVAVFGFALTLYQRGWDILTLTYLLMVFFTIFTLLLANGINRRTFVAILSSFATLAVSLFLFQLTMTYGVEIDYAALDYIVGNQDLESIFIAGISLAGLGAVMDVSVTISSSLYELKQKTPGITTRQMVHSGREIGHDIMGTMICVLLFTYLCGLLPLIIIKSRNSISYLTIIRLQVPFEICRFLMGGIEILLGIPVSIAIATLFFKDWRKHS